jgi:hypothetical protein
MSRLVIFGGRNRAINGISSGVATDMVSMPGIFAIQSLNEVVQNGSLKIGWSRKNISDGVL